MRKAIVAMVVCAASIAWADKVYLTDGTVLEGKLKAKTAEKIVFEYERGKYKSLSSSEVERIVREDFAFPPAEGDNPPKAPKPSGPAPPGWTAETKRVKVATPDGEKEKDITCYTNTIGMKFVLIPSGEFMMGSPAGELQRRDEEGPQHVVRIKAFFLGTKEVTQGEYDKVMTDMVKVMTKLAPGEVHLKGENNSSFKGKNNPVEKVSWESAVAFCFWLSQKEGVNFRLPTEAEWEYACRAGSTTPFYFGQTISTDQANYNANYIYGTGQKGKDRGKTMVGGMFPANAFGAYDMHGNVREWCEDWYDINYYAYAATGDKDGPRSHGYGHVVRGGSWMDGPSILRSAARFGCKPPSDTFGDQGFRVVVSW